MKNKSTFFVDENSFMFPDNFGPSTWVEHIPFSFWVTAQFKPSVFVELGTYYGVSYFSVCQIVSKYQLKTKCFAIDNWNGDQQSGFYGEEVYASVFTYNQKRYSSFSTLIRSSFDTALSYFEDNSIDMLHIDGYHTYEEVKKDFENWRPKLTENALVLLHDINVRERNFGVYRLWEELKQQYKSFGFLHGYGLGVIGVGVKYPSNIEKLFAATKDPAREDFIRQYFARMGSGLNYICLYEKLNANANAPID